MKRRALLAVLLVAALVGAPLVLGSGHDIIEAVFQTFTGPAIPAPPVVLLTTPQDGSGTPLRLLVAGEARADGRVMDVQLRVDGAPWESVLMAPRSEAVAAFEAQLDLTPGEHLIEARAYDGIMFSLATAVRVRAGDPTPPTVRILTPLDGSGVEKGMLTIRGLVEGTGRLGVQVRLDDAPPQEARMLASDGRGASWEATMPVPEGTHRITARPFAAGWPGVDRSVQIQVGKPTPPTLVILRPSEPAAYGTRGDGACAPRCIAFSGSVISPSSPIQDVLVALDEGFPRSILDTPGASLVAGATTAWSWPLGADDAFTGPHRATFVAVAEDGTRSAPRAITFHTRASRGIAIEGDDAPRPTHTPLSFRLVAEGVFSDRAVWSLNGADIATGETVQLTLAQPGEHLLAIRAPDANGRLGTARMPLYAVNRPPTIAIGATPAPATLPTRFVADAEDRDGQVVRYRWEFGDGQTQDTTTASTSHVYARAGERRANVTAFDDRGAASERATMLVHIPNHLPTAAFSWLPRAPTVLDGIRFADASTDPEGRLASWHWTFGDGAESDERSPTHRYLTRGDHLVTLTVADADGGTSVASALVTVVNLPPVADFTSSPERPETGATVVFADASAKPDGEIVSRTWHIGERITQGLVVTHVFHAPGRYPVTLLVEDDQGARASRTRQVVVANAAPVVRDVLLEPPEPYARQPILFRAVVLDAEGEPLGMRWLFGDGTESTLAEPLHRYLRSGVYEASLLVTDAAGDVGRHDFHVTIRNAPPDVVLKAPAVPARAGLPTTLSVDTVDPDGRVARIAFDMDDDGMFDCDGLETTCTFTYPSIGVYSARVLVEDEEGAATEASRTIDVLAPPSGLAPPVVSIAWPRANDRFGGEVLVAGRATGAAPIARVELQIRNDTWALSGARGPWALAEGTTEWRVALDTRAFPDGRHLLVVRATDEVGTVGEARVVVVLGNDRSASRVNVVVVNFEDDRHVSRDVTIRGSAYHPEGITSVRWRVDNAPWRSASGNPLAWTVPLVVRDLDPGAHVLEVAGYRGLSESSVARVRFFVADDRPAILVDVAPGAFSSGLLRLEGRIAGVDDARVLWRVDAFPWREMAPAPDGSWSIAEDTSSWTNGHHTLAVKAVSTTTGRSSEIMEYQVRVRNLDLGEPPAAKPLTNDVPGPTVGLLLVAILAAARTFGLPPRRLS